MRNRVRIVACLLALALLAACRPSDAPKEPVDPNDPGEPQVSTQAVEARFAA